MYDTNTGKLIGDEEKWGLLYVVLNQGVRTQAMQFHQANIMTVLGTIGGQVVAIIGISKIALSNF